MYKSAISYFFLLICLTIPHLSNASVAYKISEKQPITETSSDNALLVKLDQAALEGRIGRKLKWKEKFVLRKVTKKTKKQARKLDNRTSQENSGAGAGFFISLLSLLLIYLGFLGFSLLILVGFIGGLISIFVCVSALKRIKRDSLRGKGFAIIGLFLGIIICRLVLQLITALLIAV